ncbi:hypothetical protein U8335_13710 [Roseiconus lacunae]|uniref:hypothetical protein n=1 Tax=Roseiconus lacunae TaxID=2605694 RepID=UPI00309335C7|nr:hypothetical protein U8335_13710 [Stieleria sp. HD01]
MADVVAQYIRGKATHHTIMLGLWITLFRAAHPEKPKQELDDWMQSKTGVSRTQQNNSVHVFQRAGRRLFAEPELCSRFVDTALKKLCSPSVPASALHEAIQLARAGKKIRIDDAERLIAKHGAQQQTENIPKQRSKQSRSIASQPNAIADGQGDVAAYATADKRLRAITQSEIEQRMAEAKTRKDNSHSEWTFYNGNVVRLIAVPAKGNKRVSEVELLHAITEAIEMVRAQNPVHALISVTGHSQHQQDEASHA